MKKMILPSVLALMTVVMVACCGNCEPAITSYTWQVVEMEGEPVQAMEDGYTLTFAEDGNVNGRGDCNSMFFKYTLGEDGALKLENGGATRMLCPFQVYEDKYMDILNNCDAYSIKDGKLSIIRDGKAQLVLEKFVPLTSAEVKAEVEAKESAE